MEQKTEQTKTEQTMSEQTTSEQTTSEHPTSTVAEPTVEEIATLALMLACSTPAFACRLCALYSRCVLESATKDSSPKKSLKECPKKFVRHAKDILEDSLNGKGEIKEIAQKIVSVCEKIDFSWGGSDNAED